MKAWIISLRLRTLPLAIAVIAVGGTVAYVHGHWDWSIWGLTVLTTILLQILSNLANEYGDFEKGTDNDDRIGPIRSMQDGSISKPAMQRAVALCGLLAFGCGIALLQLALSGTMFWVFLGLGIFALVGAVLYTMTDMAYGYRGLGDIAVFVFFGLLGVVGSYYLLANSIHPHIWWPAVTIGVFSVAVLNVNNVRDLDNDRVSGKMTFALRLGQKGAIRYHSILLLVGLSAAMIFTFLNDYHPIQWIFLLVVPLLWKNAAAVGKYAGQEALNPYLKQMVLTTLLFAVLFCSGLILSQSL